MSIAHYLDMLKEDKRGAINPTAGMQTQVLQLQLVCPSTHHLGVSKMSITGAQMSAPGAQSICLITGHLDMLKEDRRGAINPEPGMLTSVVSA